MEKAAFRSLQNTADSSPRRLRVLPREEKGTVTDLPVGSRTTVPELTQVGLTRVRDGTGKHHRYDRAPIFLRIGSGYDPAFGSLRKLA